MESFMEETKDLADCIPQELVAEIRNRGKEQKQLHVYRVAKRGKIDDIAFCCSYEESLIEGRVMGCDLKEIGTYSTSCYLTAKRPEKFLKFLKRKYFQQYPQPQIIEGYAICGLSQLTIERLSDYDDEEHVDWWIYKGSLEQVKQIFQFTP